MPYILAAGFGLASIGAGQLYKQQSEDIYQNNYLESKVQSEAEPFYEDANGKHHNYLILTYAGSAILLTDAVLFIIRQARFKKDLKLYNQWCNGATVSFTPTVQYSTPVSPKGMTGINISFSF